MNPKWPSRGPHIGLSNGTCARKSGKSSFTGPAGWGGLMLVELHALKYLANPILIYAIFDVSLDTINISSTYTTVNIESLSPPTIVDARVIIR